MGLKVCLPSFSSGTVTSSSNYAAHAMPHEVVDKKIEEEYAVRAVETHEDLDEAAAQVATNLVMAHEEIVLQRPLIETEYRIEQGRLVSAFGERFDSFLKYEKPLMRDELASVERALAVERSANNGLLISSTDGDARNGPLRHYIYLYARNEQNPDRVSLKAVEFRGSVTELKEFALRLGGLVQQVGLEDGRPIFRTTFFKDATLRWSDSEIHASAASSYRGGRLHDAEIKSYLARMNDFVQFRNQYASERERSIAQVSKRLQHELHLTSDKSEATRRVVGEYSNAVNSGQRNLQVRPGVAHPPSAPPQYSSASPAREGRVKVERTPWRQGSSAALRSLPLHGERGIARPVSRATVVPGAEGGGIRVLGTRSSHRGGKGAAELLGETRQNLVRQIFRGPTRVSRSADGAIKIGSSLRGPSPSPNARFPSVSARTPMQALVVRGILVGRGVTASVRRLGSTVTKPLAPTFDAARASVSRALKAVLTRTSARTGRKEGGITSTTSSGKVVGSAQAHRSARRPEAAGALAVRRTNVHHAVVTKRGVIVVREAPTPSRTAQFVGFAVLRRGGILTHQTPRPFVPLASRSHRATVAGVVPARTVPSFLRRLSGGFAVKLATALGRPVGSFASHAVTTMFTRRLSGGRVMLSAYSLARRFFPSRSRDARSLAAKAERAFAPRGGASVVKNLLSHIRWGGSNVGGALRARELSKSAFAAWRRLKGMGSKVGWLGLSDVTLENNSFFRTLRTRARSIVRRALRKEGEESIPVRRALRPTRLVARVRIAVARSRMIVPMSVRAIAALYHLVIGWLAMLRHRRGVAGKWRSGAVDERGSGGREPREEAMDEARDAANAASSAALYTQHEPTEHAGTFDWEEDGYKNLGAEGERVSEGLPTAFIVADNSAPNYFLETVRVRKDGGLKESILRE